MNEPRIQHQAPINFKNVDAFKDYVDNLKGFANDKGGDNLFATTNGGKLIFINGDGTNKDYMDAVCAEIKRICLKYPLHQLLADITTLSRFPNEQDIQDENYELMKKLSSEVIFIGEEMPVHNSESQQLFRTIVKKVNNGEVKGCKILAAALINNSLDSDGVIRRNTILRIYKEDK